MKIYFGKEEYNIPVISQWENYRYAPELMCECGSTNFEEQVVGIAEIGGIMMSLNECPFCHDKFRTHISHTNGWRGIFALRLHNYNQHFRIK